MERCFACDAKLKKGIYTVWTIDGQKVYVGGDCASKIIIAEAEGWQPPKGGPRLFKEKPNA